MLYDGIILPIAGTLIVYITTRQLYDPVRTYVHIRPWIRPLRVVLTSLFFDTGCDWSVEWLDFAASGVTLFIVVKIIETALSIDYFFYPVDHTISYALGL